MALCFYISGGRFLKVNNDKRFFIRVNFQMFRGCAGRQTTRDCLVCCRMSRIFGLFHSCYCVAPKQSIRFPGCLHWEAVSLGAGHKAKTFDLWSWNPGPARNLPSTGWEGSLLTGRKGAAQAGMAAAEGVWWRRQCLHCLCDHRGQGGALGWGFSSAAPLSCCT